MSEKLKEKFQSLPDFYHPPFIPGEESTKRAAVIAEARTWLSTPFHPNACVKGHGVDCGRFLIAVYSSVGLMPEYEPGYWSPQFHLHSGEPSYMAEMLKFAHEIQVPPEPADIVMIHLGRQYAHSGIVIEWPNQVIHAPAADMQGVVQISDASKDALFLHGGMRFPPKFFSPFNRETQ
jgi:hypothetical protein